MATVSSDDSTRSTSQQKLVNIRRGLFVTYLAVGQLLVGTSPFGAIILTTLWLGFALSISGMEAWLKFQAPFCPKPFALDIGRTIFPALNTVESALCVTLWHRHRFHLPMRWMGLLSTILLLDLLVLTPRLVQRGKHTVFQHVKEHGGAKVSTTSSEFLALQSELQSLPEMAKKDKIHIVYVVLELVKVITLSQMLKFIIPSLATTTV